MVCERGIERLGVECKFLGTKCSFLTYPNQKNENLQTLD